MKTAHGIFRSLIGILAFAAAGTSLMGEAAAMTFTARDGVVIVEGVTKDDSFDEFEEVLDDNPGTRTVVLDQIGGSDNDEVNLRMAALIRSKGLSTHLTSASVIESGGIELFLGGKERTMERGARIGVHSWIDEDDGYEGRDLPYGHPDHQSYLLMYRALEAPEALYWFIIKAAPASAMYFLNEDEIRRFGILTAPIEPALSARRSGSVASQVTGLVIDREPVRRDDHSPAVDDDDDDEDDTDGSSG